jgi:hypothetical protein
VENFSGSKLRLKRQKLLHKSKNYFLKYPAPQPDATSFHQQTKENRRIRRKRQIELHKYTPSNLNLEFAA